MVVGELTCLAPPQQNPTIYTEKDANDYRNYESCNDSDCS